VLRHLWAPPLTGPRPEESDAGWSSPVARQAHNLKVTGSNPVPAPTLLELKGSPRGSLFSFLRRRGRGLAVPEAGRLYVHIRPGARRLAWRLVLEAGPPNPAGPGA